MKESIIRKEIRDWLESQYIFCWPNITVGIPDGAGKYRKHPMPGIADISGVLPGGKALAIECKVKGNKTDRDRFISQVKFLSRVRSCGGIGFFAYSLDDVKLKLEPLLKQTHELDIVFAKNWFNHCKNELDTMQLSEPNTYCNVSRPISRTKSRSYNSF